jgi:hypothetical protein
MAIEVVLVNLTKPVNEECVMCHSPITPPEVMKFATAWQDANFELIDKTAEVAPGITEPAV